MVDTGALNTIISPPVAEQDHLAKVGEPTDGYAGLACPVRFTHYRVSAWRVVYKGRSLALEQFALAPQTVFSTGLSGVLPPGANGLLGAATLLRYNPVVVDYRDGYLFLGPLAP